MPGVVGDIFITLDELSSIFSRDINPAPAYNDLKLITDAASNAIYVKQPLSISADYTPDGSVSELFLDSSGGNIRITLDASLLSGKTIIVTKSDTSTNLITFEGKIGAETLSYVAMPVSDLLMLQGESAPIYCDGTNFFVQ